MRMSTTVESCVSFIVCPPVVVLVSANATFNRDARRGGIVDIRGGCEMPPQRV